MALRLSRRDPWELGVRSSPRPPAHVRDARPFRYHLSVIVRSAPYGKQLPGVGYPLQFVFATVFKLDPGANHQGRDTARDEDFAGCALAATRAAMCTAMPATSERRSSTSPV
jgi:hypothetical protein